MIQVNIYILHLLRHKIVYVLRPLLEGDNGISKLLAFYPESMDIYSDCNALCSSYEAVRIKLEMSGL